MKIFHIFLMVLVLMHASFASHIPGSEEDNHTQDISEDSQVQETGKRFYYYGFAKIEQTSFDEIIQKLEANGCKQQSESSNCYYEIAELFETNNEVVTNASAVPVDDDSQIEKKEGIKVIIVHPNGASFGPDNLILTETRIYAARDIEGSEDIEKYKLDVKETISRLGNFVSIKEGTWSVDSEDSSDRVYSTSTGSQDPKLLRLIEKQENGSYNYIGWGLLAILVAGILLFILYRKFKGSQ